MREQMMRQYFDAVDAIACSPRVKVFYVGYTYRTGKHRLREQRQFNGDWKHVVAVADKLTENDAKKLEGRLQEWCKKEPRFVTNTKYSKEHLVRAFNPGKKSPTPLENVHSVYMMWRETD